MMNDLSRFFSHAQYNSHDGLTSPTKRSKDLPSMQKEGNGWTLVDLALGLILSSGILPIRNLSERIAPVWRRNGLSIADRA
jgi:hypothetical protein